MRLSLSKNPGVDKGPQPLMFNPALTTCASERMKTQRFSYFADFAARERMREAKPVKLKKVAFSHFFDTLREGRRAFSFCCALRRNEQRFAGDDKIRIGNVV